MLGFPSLNEMSDEDETHDVRVHQTSRLSRYSFVAEVIADQETVSSGDISDEAEVGICVLFSIVIARPPFLDLFFAR